MIQIVGTLSSSPGLKKRDDCVNCAAGKYCDGTSLAIDCAAGYYCSGGSSTATPCQAGMNCDNAPVFVEDVLGATLGRVINLWKISNSKNCCIAFLENHY